jgi:DNA-binding transcriptional regulator YhcF (GntR family)
MDIRIDSSSEVPIRSQLTEQVIFLITTERFRPGDFLPSVRDLARRLKIHHNTVSDAYKNLVERGWLERRRGSRLMVASRDESSAKAATLDDLINTTICVARDNGYSMQALRERVLERLRAQAPDHILVVEQDAGLRALIAEELKMFQAWPVASCSREQLAANPDLAVAALAVTTQHALGDVEPLVSKDRPVIPVRYSTADQYLKTVADLRTPSVIAIVSASKLFLEVARAILTPALRGRHELREIFIADEDVAAARAADLIFCDSIACRRLRVPKAIHYRLLVPEAIEYISTAMQSYQL